MKRIFTILALASTVLFAGCASNMTSRDYSMSAARQKMSVEMGIVESVRNVRIEGQPRGASGVGSFAGGVLGSIAGGRNGGGLGSVALGVVGSVVGGVVGHVADKKVNEVAGIEITIRMTKSDELVAITQAIDEQEPFAAGDKVRVLTASGVARVTH